MNKTNYCTANIYEAAYLLTVGFQLAGKQRNGAKIVLEFKASQKLIDESLKFYNGGRVDARAFSEAFKNIKNFIFEANKGNVAV
ncbi:MAG: DUF5659 domain-containing protein [Candidatus Omnitrophica bacterium]|nr:DUF5659 domain-containing protein [Candidatus Omnitrophota bacterium]